MRRFRDPQGEVWTAAEVIRYGIGRKPVTPDTALVSFESSKGDRHEALLGTGEITRLTEPELGQLITEVSRSMPLADQTCRDFHSAFAVAAPPNKRLKLAAPFCCGSRPSEG